LLPAVTWLTSLGPVEFIVPERGPVEEQYREFGPVSVLGYSALVYGPGRRARVRLAAQTAREVRLFRAEFRRRRPDVVVVVTTVLPAALIAARLERIPTFVYAAELYDQTPVRRLWGVLLARGTAAMSTGIVCSSDMVARQFPARTKARVAVGYPAVGTEYGRGIRERGRAQLGVDPDATCLVAVGSISRGRGQDVAMRALPLIRKRYPDATLVLVGDPHPREPDMQFGRELRSLAESLGLGDAVVFAGALVDAMPDVYAAADVVVKPARVAESFGRVGPEALMAGRPVVASAVGGIPEVLRDGLDALLVPPDAPHALAAAAMRLLGDAALRQRLVDSGRQRVLDSFGPGQALDAWRSVLEPAPRRRGH
jgi:glycosyltransferase involved in cell wall biosynthesis